MSDFKFVPDFIPGSDEDEDIELSASSEFNNSKVVPLITTPFFKYSPDRNPGDCMEMDMYYEEGLPVLARMDSKGSYFPHYMFKKFDDVADFLIQEPVQNFCVQVPDNLPTYAYFDLDHKPKKGDDFKVWLKEHFDFIQKKFAEIGFRGKWLLLKSEKETRKFSVHGHSTNLKFKNLETQKAFWHSFEDYPDIDRNVYNRHAKFRLPFSGKPGEDNHLIPLNHMGRSKKEILFIAMITCPLDDSIIVPFEPKRKRKEHKTKTKSKRIRTFTNPDKLQEKVRVLLKDSNITLTPRGGGLYYVRSEVKRNCPHGCGSDRNGAKLSVNINGEITYKCMNAKCSQKPPLVLRSAVKIPEMKNDGFLGMLITKHFLGKFYLTSPKNLVGHYWDDKKKLWTDFSIAILIRDLYDTMKTIIEQHIAFESELQEPGRKQTVEGLLAAKKYPHMNYAKVTAAVKWAAINFEDKHIKQKINRKHPWLIPIKNKKVIDVRDLKITDRKREHWFSEEFDADYTEVCDNRVPTFFEKLYPDEGHAEYCRLLIAVLMTGFPLRVVLFALGYGSNGKGTIFQIIYKIMNKFVGTVDSDFLIEKKATSTEVATPMTMNFIDKRLCVMSETKDGSRLDSKILKKFASGGTDKACGRNLFSNDYVDFQIKCKYVVQSQYLPLLTQSDRATTDRVELWPHNSTFYKTEAELEKNSSFLDIEQKRFKHTRNAKDIDWLMDNSDQFFSYCIRKLSQVYQEKGGLPSDLLEELKPKVCESAKNEKLEELDILTEFLGTLEVIDEKKEEPNFQVQELYQEFVHYANDKNTNQNWIMSIKTFKRRLWQRNIAFRYRKQIKKSRKSGTALRVRPKKPKDDIFAM